MTLTRLAECCLVQVKGSGEFDVKELAQGLQKWKGAAQKKGKEEPLGAVLDRRFAADAHGSRLVYIVER